MEKVPLWAAPWVLKKSFPSKEKEYYWQLEYHRLRSKAYLGMSVYLHVQITEKDKWKRQERRVGGWEGTRLRKALIIGVALNLKGNEEPWHWMIIFWRARAQAAKSNKLGSLWCPVIKTLRSQCRRPRLDPWSRKQIPQIPQLKTLHATKKTEDSVCYH